MRTWSDLVDREPEQRQIWNDAIRFFADAKPRFKTIRDDIGGHYLESAAKYAIETMSLGTTGRLAIVTDGTGADTKLHFSGELVTRLLVKDMPAGETTDERLQAYLAKIFREVFAGWDHVVKAVHVVAVLHLVPRFL